MTKKEDAGTGSLLAALAEAGFLLGLERNRSVLTICSDGVIMHTCHIYKFSCSGFVMCSTSVILLKWQAMHLYL